MNFGYIVEPNSKGQIVIPKKLRKKLGITEGDPLNLGARGDGIYLQPIRMVIPKITKTDAYAKVLEKTQGTWAADDWLETEKKRKKTELKAAKERKNEW